MGDSDKELFNEKRDGVFVLWLQIPEAHLLTWINFNPSLH